MLQQSLRKGSHLLIPSMGHPNCNGSEKGKEYFETHLVFELDYRSRMESSNV